MSIYPEGSVPSGSDSTNQLLLKYAEELIATQFVDPHGYSIYPTGGATDNAIKTGDSLQNILAKLLGAAQGGYVFTDLSGVKLSTVSLYDSNPPLTYIEPDQVDIFVSSGSAGWQLELPPIATSPPDGRESNYQGPYRVSVSSNSIPGTTVDGVSVGLGESIEFFFNNGVWTHKLYPAGDIDLGNVVDLTTAQTVAGAKTWTGQQQATGQAATDEDSLMTRGLSDVRSNYDRRMKEIIVGVVLVGGSAITETVNGRTIGSQNPAANDSAVRVISVQVTSWYSAGIGHFRSTNYLCSMRYIGSGKWGSDGVEVFNTASTDDPVTISLGVTVTATAGSEIDITVTPPASGQGSTRNYSISVTAENDQFNW